MHFTFIILHDNKVHIRLLYIQCNVIVNHSVYLHVHPDVLVLLQHSAGGEWSLGHLLIALSDEQTKQHDQCTCTFLNTTCTRVERCARIRSISRYFGGIPRHYASISRLFLARFRLFSPEYRPNACNLANRRTRNGEKAKRQY